MEKDLKFYAVRSKDGKWLRRKGYGGYGECWVDELTSARVYNRPGPARAQISWWFTNYPTYGCPDLVVFSTTISEVINEEDRLNKRREKKLKEAGIQEISVAKTKLELAKKEFEEAERELNETVRKVKS